MLGEREAVPASKFSFDAVLLQLSKPSNGFSILLVEFRFLRNAIIGHPASKDRCQILASLN